MQIFVEIRQLVQKLLELKVSRNGHGDAIRTYLPLKYGIVEHVAGIRWTRSSVILQISYPFIYKFPWQVSACS